MRRISIKQCASDRGFSRTR